MLTRAPPKHSNKGAPQIGYHKAMQHLQATGMTGLYYNRTTASYWFDYNSTTGSQQGRHQIWIDTPGSTAIKYAALRLAGVRGVAWWHTGNVAYGTPNQEAHAMWDALAAFQEPRTMA